MAQNRVQSLLEMEVTGLHKRQAGHCSGDQGPGAQDGTVQSPLGSPEDPWRVDETRFQYMPENGFQPHAQETPKAAFTDMAHLHQKPHA